MKQLIVNKEFKIEILDGFLHIEKAINNKFNTKNTLFIPEKESLNNIDFEVEENNDTYLFAYKNFKFEISKDLKDVKDINISNSKNKLIEIHNSINSGELPKFNKTPDIYFVYDNPRITLPKNGYSLNNTEKYIVEENVVDIYLLFVNKDPLLLRSEIVKLTGRNELVRFKNLGFWDSKYYEYNEKTVFECINTFKKYDLPLDNFVIDTDWREAKDDGFGYDINTKLFPNMKGLLKKIHDENIEVMFNDHPEPVSYDIDIFNEKEIEYRETNLKKLLSIGLDTWWYDRNWKVHLVSPTPNIAFETLGSYAYYSITENYYKNLAKEKYYRRPVIMSNVVDIINGSYMHISDTASHKYTIFWSGDISSDLGSLNQEVTNLVLSGNNLITYFNSDCGGHVGNPNKEEYLRWIQYGALSPIFRIHCTNNVEKFREPWNYNKDTVKKFKKYVDLRYRLLGLIYSEAYKSYLYGTPIFKGLAFNYPKDKNCINNTSSYMLSNKILVSPIGLTEVKVMPKSFIKGRVKSTFFDGIEFKGKPIFKSSNKDNLYFRLTGGRRYNEFVPAYKFSAIHEFNLVPREDIEFYICSDDGIKVIINDKEVYKNLSFHGSLIQHITNLKKNKEYKIKLYYFQDGGEADLHLMYKHIENEENIKVYLPNDNWINPHSGEIIKGNKVIEVSKDFKELPIYIKEGSLIPLFKTKLNTSLIDFNDLIFEYYPSLEVKDEGILYLDDLETTAYKDGYNQIVEYSSYYDKKNNCFIIKFNKKVGKLEGNNIKHIKFKFISDELSLKVKNIYLNDKDIEFKYNLKNKSNFILSENEDSLTGNNIVFTCDIDVNYENILKINL